MQLMNAEFRWKSTASLSCFAAGLALTGLGHAGDAIDWRANTIAPVANPIFFEDPQINSEVRPLFIQHNVPDDFVGGGDVQVYALQLRVALSERLALIATKDGWIDMNVDGIPHKEGWADLAAGLKYALIDDRDSQFILTPGFTIELPTGQSKVFQGNGDGEWNAFLSLGKGFNNLHFTLNTGVRLPNDMGEETSSWHYSAMVDYYTCRWFIPFAVVNGFTVLSDGDQLPFDTEGYDLINFGSTDANGWTGVAVGGGFRSRLHAKVDLGFAYEVAVASPEGLFDDRFTVDLLWRF